MKGQKKGRPGSGHSHGRQRKTSGDSITENRRSCNENPSDYEIEQGEKLKKALGALVERLGEAVEE